MSKAILGVTLAFALGATLPGAAAAQITQPAPPTKNLADAPAGVYAIDTEHSSVIARVTHAGVSYSTLRFGVTKATLTWDPARAANIKLDVTVDTVAHTDPIAYRLLPGAPQMLNTAMFPTATFVSKAVKATGAGKADVEGVITLIGMSKPAVIHVQLVGVNKTAKGQPLIGFTGTLKLKRSDFGTPFVPLVIGDDVEVQVDGEFIGG